MGYGLDLQSISIWEYGEMLKHQDLLPGRRLLREGLDEKIADLTAAGLTALSLLYERLRTPRSLKALAASTGISAEYLTLLRREIGSLVPKPVAIADFPGLPSEATARLSQGGIKTSKDLYDISNGFRDTAAVCERAGISEVVTAELFSLCDLVRVNGIGPVSARMLWDAGYNRAADIAGAEAAAILAKFTVLNEQKQYTKVRLKEKDMQFCIDGARLLLRGGGDEQV